MKVLVTGATGFVGRAVVENLRSAGHEVISLARKSPQLAIDITDGEAVFKAVQNTKPEVVIHLVGIIAEKGQQTFQRLHVEATQNIVRAAESVQARYLHMSALGSRLDSASRYFSTKAQAEDIVKKSTLNYTIFQPSLIFGQGDDFFGQVLKNLVSEPPIVPVIGDGHFLFRPVWVEDVAQSFVQAISLPNTIGETYILVGEKEYSFKTLLELELKALHKKKWMVSIPVPLMNIMVPLMQILPNPPITRDQYLMLLQGNTGNPEKMLETFNLMMPTLESKLPEILSTKQ